MIFDVNVYGEHRSCLSNDRSVQLRFLDLKVNDEWRGHEHWAITAEEYIADTPEVLKKDHVNLEPYNT